SWDATKKAFMQAVDQESAIRDAVARLYSIGPREKGDYKDYASSIRELFKQAAEVDNHVDFMHRIILLISSDGRTKMLEHSEDIKRISSLEGLRARLIALCTHLHPSSSASIVALWVSLLMTVPSL
ncbi:hypothetical protein DFQ26_001004, partial [Actinomortierella ambigua]